MLFISVGINNQTNEVVQNGEIILQSPTNPLEEQDEDIHLAPVAEVLEFLYIGKYIIMNEKPE